MSPIFAADTASPPVWQLALAAVAVVALVVRELFAYLKTRQASASAQALSADTERMRKMAGDVHFIRVIIEREHPISQQKRIYYPIDLDERLQRIQQAVDELHDRSGVWTDPGLGRPRQ